MTLSFALCVAVLLLGLVLYYLTTGKPQELGRIMFAVGLLVTLLRFSGTLTLHG